MRKHAAWPLPCHSLKLPVSLPPCVTHQDANGDEQLELGVERATQVEGRQLRQEQGATLDRHAHTCTHRQAHKRWRC